MASPDLLLHPVRLRVVQALLGREMTTAELRAELPDVAPATLYRQVATLLDGELLEVVAERRVRGAVERTYRLRDTAPSVSADEAATMSPEQHQRAFSTFVAGLLADFERYVGHGDVDLCRDLVGYRTAAMYLTDEELLSLVTDLRAVLAPRLEHGPAPGRRRRLLTTITLPAEPWAETPAEARTDPPGTPAED